jgi:hypothetical protein
MSLVTEILSYDQLHDLWGAGFTVVRRNADPYEIDPKLIPRGMAYQWNPTKSDGVDVAPSADWKPVPYSRHEGIFAPWGMPGNIERGGLVLCERPKVDVDAATDKAHAKAYQNVTDWLDRQGAAGFTGEIIVGGQTRLGTLDKLTKRKVGDEKVGADALDDFVQIGSTKTIETIVAVPRDMTPHIAAIFQERDRLEAEVVRKDRTLAPGPIADKFYAAIDADKGAPWWPTLRAILLPIAVDNVRANLKKETTDE